MMVSFVNHVLILPYIDYIYNICHYLSSFYTVTTNGVIPMSSIGKKLEKMDRCIDDAHKVCKLLIDDESTDNEARTRAIEASIKLHEARRGLEKTLDVNVKAMEESGQARHRTPFGAVREYLKRRRLYKECLIQIDTITRGAEAFSRSAPEFT